MDGDGQNQAQSGFYLQAKDALKYMSDEELQQLQGDVQIEMDERVAEAKRLRYQERKDRKYEEWLPYYTQRRERKDAVWEEKQENNDAMRAKTPRYGSSTEDESDEEENEEGDDERTSDEDTDGEESIDENILEPPVYDEYYLSRRFDHELDHPKKYSRTMNEGEIIPFCVSARIPISDEESESSGTSPATSDEDIDSEIGGEINWGI